jgi:hypothetical protein
LQGIPIHLFESAWNLQHWFDQVPKFLQKYFGQTTGSHSQQIHDGNEKHAYTFSPGTLALSFPLSFLLWLAGSAELVGLLIPILSWLTVAGVDELAIVLEEE